MICCAGSVYEYDIIVHIQPRKQRVYLFFCIPFAGKGALDLGYTAPTRNMS